MRSSIFICLLATLLLWDTAAAQDKITISGTISDASNKETIINASISVQDMKGIGAVSNEYGFYSLTIPAGAHTILFSYIGYTADTLELSFDKSIVHNVLLSKLTRELKDVVVKAAKGNEHVTNAQVGIERINMAEINKLPVLLGERDILKSIQLLPGIKSAGEGNSGFNVRGGSADQNLILLDEAPVYNASHLLGFFSTFNSDAIKDATVYKGNEPAQYGGRLSSVLDIKMKEGNKEDYEVNGSLGLISSKLSVEGPLGSGKGSFFVSGRRTYADLFLKLSPDASVNSSKLYFYDLNGKGNYRLGKNDVLYLSGYTGRDQLGLGGSFGITWGNSTGTARWNHILNNKLFSNTSLIYSKYDYKISIESNKTSFDITSSIRDVNLKEEVQYFPDNKHSLRFGVNSILHRVLPGEVSGNESVNSTKLQTRDSWDNALYASDDWKTTKKLSINYGLRLSSFSVLGGGDYYDLDADNNVTGQKYYDKGEFVETYLNLEPRLSFAYLLNTTSSIKGGYARNTQNMHLISNSTTSNPTDKWISSSNNIRPEIADQVSLGYFRNFKDNTYEFSIESYFKNMQNQIDYRDGADVLSNDSLETQLLFGHGRAYGVEFYLKKKKGRFTGWIGYTLSRTEKQISGINNGNWYAAKQDRTHDLSIVGSYELTPKLSLSAVFVYYTGNAVTFPSGKYYIDNHYTYQYTERNGYRMPAYHRLDISLSKKLKDHKHYSSDLVFGLYNAYGHQNAYIISFEQDDNNPYKTNVVQTALFRWVPSISWNFKIK